MSERSRARGRRASAIGAGLAIATLGTLDACRVASAAEASPIQVVVAFEGEHGLATVAPPGVGVAPIEHLDAYTAPRLAGYTDANPCTPPVDFELRVAPSPAARNGAVVASAAAPPREPAPGTTIALAGSRVELPSDLHARELVLHVLTRTGKAELAARRSVPIESGAVLPLFVKDDFAGFYAAAAATAFARDGAATALLEYAGDLGFCDPCVADPLPIAELHQLGATWAADPPPKANPMQSAAAPQDHQGGARNVFVTRYRLRLGAGERSWPALALRETPDRRDFQVRFVVRRPYTAGPIACAEGETYKARLARQRESAIDALSALTGWPRADIEKRASP